MTPAPFRGFFTALLCLSVVHGLFDTAPAAEPSGLPSEFTAVDTSRFMTAPDPVPLEATPAFPKLKFERPVELTFANDDSNRLYVVEQAGIVRVFDNDSQTDESQVFLDLRDVVLREGNEEGLLGLAFHPEFRRNGEFFVYYSTRPRSSVISRFRVGGDDKRRADRDSEEVLLRIEQPYSNHNGGSLRFGPDGFLYIGLGDGGLADDPHSNGQNLSTLLGSILRIDVDRKDEGLEYAIPDDNPFVGRAGARGEIWAYGLRNVWRLGFDRETGELWAGDVGQNRFEEINLIVRGGNYGWNLREGLHDFEPQSGARPGNLIDPVVEYFRGEGQSVTGGTVYRGERLADYRGQYIYADYLSGHVWAFARDAGEVRNHRRVAETGLEIAAFGEDAQGELYLCAFDGRIYRLQPREGKLTEAAKQFPRKLSETGLFQSVAENVPGNGLIPYEVNVPFWSDYSVKDRYIALPEKGKVKFQPNGAWEFPVGTVFVKTFWMHQDRVQMAKPRRLETRLLVHSPSGWAGYTYVYNEEETEATLLGPITEEGSLPGPLGDLADGGGMLKPVRIETEEGPIDQPYYFPSRTDCMACHTRQAGFVLGLNTRQMNRTLAYHGDEANQIELLSKLGAFSNPPDAMEKERARYPDWGFGNLDRGGEASAVEQPRSDDPQTLARAWLDVNCAMCHRPEGIAPANHDFRFDSAIKEMRLVDVPPKQGHLSREGTPLLEPGAPDHSELVRRIEHRGPRQMPPLASNLVDPRGVEAIRDWIEKLRGPTATEADK